MKELKRYSPITKPNYVKIILSITLGIWFLLAIILLKPLKKIYLAPIQTSRIGHFVLDTEIMLARIHIDQLSSRKKFLVIWIPESLISNHYVYTIWKQIIHIAPYNLFTSATLLAAIYLEKLTKIKLTYRFIGWDGYLPYEHLLLNKEAIFHVPKNDEQECIKTLQLNGIDADKAWVCILARDSEYLNRMQPGLNWDYNSYRNSDIDTYKEAAEYIASKNILVFRMGTHVGQPFVSKKSELIVDYANSDWRSDKLDVFLAAKCLFFISSGTGLDAVAFATRKPVVTVNMAQPLVFIKCYKDQIFILKKFFFRKTNKFLNIEEYYKLGVTNGFTVDNPRHFRTQDFERLGIDVIDNTPTEIKDAAEEMYELLTGKNKGLKGLSKIQKIFWDKFPDVLGTNSTTTAHSRIGKKFIEENRWLVE
jgi:putative glycosyltransferase (TIGR04372 family)